MGGHVAPTSQRVLQADFNDQAELSRDTSLHDPLECASGESSSPSTSRSSTPPPNARVRPTSSGSAPALTSAASTHPATSDAAPRRLVQNIVAGHASVAAPSVSKPKLLSGDVVTSPSSRSSPEDTCADADVGTGMQAISRALRHHPFAWSECLDFSPTNIATHKLPTRCWGPMTWGDGVDVLCRR